MEQLSYRERILMADSAVQETVTAAVEEGSRRSGQFAELCRRFSRNKMGMVGLVILIVLILTAILAPVLAPEGYDQQTLSESLIAPCKEHPMGTDNLGRDILDRVIWGARYSLSVGVVSVSIAVVVGAVLGVIAGFYGGVTESVIMRVLDVFMGIPPILLALSVAAALGGGLMNLMIAVSISSVPSFARIVRASVMSIKDQEFVEAARCTGCGSFRIMFKYVFPNCLSPLIVQGTLGVASAILAASTMSFIGLGLQPPIPEWGAMLSVGRQFLRQAWWTCTFPGVMIALTVFALNVFGDGLRDALDPKMKR